MPLVRFTGWRPGLNKVKLNHAIREHSGLGLADAKDVVDDLVDGRSPVVSVPALDAASALIEDASALGADAVMDDSE